MEKLLESIVSLFTNKSHSIGRKSLFAISLILVLLIADFSLGLTFNLRTSYKLSHIEQIERLKKDFTLDPETKEELNLIEKNVLEQKGFHFLLDWLSENTSTAIERNVYNSKIMISPTSSIRSPFWHLVTSSFTWLLVILIVPIGVFIKVGISLKSVVSVFGVAILIGIIILINSWLLWQIPVIEGNPWINYCINAVIHGLTIWILSQFQNRSKNKNTEPNKT